MPHTEMNSVTNETVDDTFLEQNIKSVHRLLLEHKKLNLKQQTKQHFQISK